MIAIIIISVIILIFAILLNIKIKAEISYLSGEFVFNVKYMCFTIFPFKEKKKKVEKKKKSPKNKAENITDEANEDTESTSEQLPTEENDELKSKRKKKEPLSAKIDKLLDIIEKIKIIWKVSKKHLCNIFKRIYIEELMIDFLIADEDAYTTAMNYGKINAAVYNLINIIRTFFTVSIKTVDIICDFDAKEPTYDFSAKITVKPSTILSAVFGILFGLLINLKKLIGNNNKKQPSDAEAVSM